jgi:hypothetical protein
MSGFDPSGDILWKDHKVVVDDAIDKLFHF